MIYDKNVDSFNFYIHITDLYDDFVHYPEDIRRFIVSDYASMHLDAPFKEYLIQESRVAAYLKVLFPFFLLSGGSFILCNLWLTLFGTFCFVQFYSFEKNYTYGRIWLFVFLVPSFTFWSVGMLKESFVIPVLFLLFYFYRKSERSGFKDVCAILWFLVFFLLAWSVKYYYTAVFILLCVGIYAVIYTKQSMYYKLGSVVCAALVLAGIGIFHPNLKLSGMAQLLYDSNNAICRLYSSFGCISFSLDGTWVSVFKNIPKALWYAINVPAWNQIQSLSSILAAIESYMLIGVLLYAVFRVSTKKVILDKKDIALFIFIACIAVLLALSTPNGGTFSRYRIVYLPVYCYILFKYTLPAKWIYTDRLK